MKRTVGSLLLAALLGFSSAAVAQEASGVITTPPTPRQEEELQRGDIVVSVINRHPLYHLDVYGMVDAPVGAVWDALTDYDDYHRFLPLVVESGVRRRTPEATWQYLKLQPPWPLHAHWMINVQTEDRSAGSISWTMADGNLRYERGYWQLRAVGHDRTRLQCHLTVDPWLDIVPGWLVEMATRQVLPDVIRGVRSRVKSRR